MADGRYLGLMDMIDGGGAGRAGDTFEGGPLSGLLNLLGIKPRGFYDRQEEQQQMAPIPMIPMPSALPPVTTSPMIGNLTPDDILAAITRGTVSPSSVYGPNAITTSVLPPAARPPYRQPSGPAAPRMPTLQEIMEADRFRRERDAAMSFERSGIFRGM